MVSVICDGNYLFHKTFSIFSNYGTKQPGQVLSDSADQGMFMRKIMTDLCYALNQIPVSGHIIFCRDSRSWRKELDIKREEYKGSRKHDEKVDWGSFFDLLDEFGKFLEINGYLYSVAKGAEGDDLLWFWNEKLKNDGHNVIIYSGDKDSHQMVESDKNRWTICWNANSKNNKLFCDESWSKNYLEKEEEVSIFNMNFVGDDEKNKIKALCNNATLEIVDKNKLIFEKILTGDKGDDVPSIFSFEKTPNKFYKITAAKASAIYENFKKSGWGNQTLEAIWKDDEFKDWVSGYVLRSLSYTDNKENRNQVSLNYHENAQLVWLSDQVIPEKVIHEMEFMYSESDKNLRHAVIDKSNLIGRSRWANLEMPSAFNPFKSFK